MTVGDKPYQLTGRQAWFADPRTDANGRVRPGAHLAALQARIAAEAARADSAGAVRPEAVPTEEGGVWNPLGPAGVGFGQADGRPRVSGRVTSIAVHPDGARAYIGTANGGTWYTNDLGGHWRSLDTYAQTAPLTGRRLGYSDALAVGAVAVAWGTDASTDVVYVGTGEPFRRYEPDSFYGVGIRVATGPAAIDPLDPTKVTWTTEAPDLAGKAIYKLACDPDTSRTGIVYAATTDGLYRRGLNADGTKPADSTAWVKVYDPPSSVCAWLGLVSSPVLVVSDVVIAPASAGSPQTVYLAVYDARTKTDQQVWQSQSGDKDSWKPVPGYTANERTSLSVSPNDPTVVYALSSATDPGEDSKQKAIQTNLAVLVNGTFQPVDDVPVNLAGEVKHSQASYDIVVAADPVDKSVVWIAGKSVKSTAGNWNASVFRGEVKAGAKPGTWSFRPVPRTANPADDLTWVGAGAHADVHAIALSGLPTAPTVWLGCDGGVFQCRVVTVVAPPPNTHGVAAGSAPGPWQPLNNGLAITQPNYLAQSPASDFLMIAGTQDNGAEERVGPAVWRLARLGDGGGCAIDPAHPSRRFVQYTSFSWFTAAARVKNYEQTLDYSDFDSPLSDLWKLEDLYSSFYSHAASRLLGNGNTALIFGSHRVWYCEDWGQNWHPLAPVPDPATWRTVPTRTNPYELKDSAGKPKPDLNQDSLYGSVIRVAFASDIVLLALTKAWPDDPRYKDPQPAALYQLNTTAPRQDPLRLSPPDPNRKPPPPPVGAYLNFPEGEIPLGLAVDQPPGPPLTCYVTFGVGQRQDKEHPNFDHVWWYDGTYWWPCGFDATVADTPVNAIVVDVDRTVFVGTDVGVFMGVPHTDGTPKTWAWTPLSNGLPEAPVLDLALVKNPNLLRAATHGRGVWELNLTEARPVIETYLRAHVSDTRRVFPPPAIDPTAFGTVPARIDASPDLVITGPPNPPPPGDLPLSNQLRPRYSDSTRVLQYALRQRQIAAVPPSLVALPPIVVDGYFDLATQRAVTAVQTAAGLPANGKVAGADWTAIVTAPYTAAAGADATYLDVSLLDTICPVNGLPDGPSLVSAATGASVYVQVNARGWQRRPQGSVNVGLLATPNFDASLATLPTLPPDWGTQFTNALTSSPATWLTGSTAWAWLSVPATTATTRPLQPEEPQVVRFPVTFPVPPGAPHLPVQWTMFAIVSDPLDQPSFAGSSVYDLVLNNRHVAVRSVTLVT